MVADEILGSVVWRNVSHGLRRVVSVDQVRSVRSEVAATMVASVEWNAPSTKPVTFTMAATLQHSLTLEQGGSRYSHVFACVRVRLQREVTGQDRIGQDGG